MTLALTTGILVAGAVYLFMRREMLLTIFGFVLLGHAGNLILLASGGASRRDEPFGAPQDLSTVADPLPQAFVLTAIVIAFSITILMLALSVTGGQDDDVHDGAQGEDHAEPAPLPDRVVDRLDEPRRGDPAGRTREDDQREVRR